MPCQSPLRIGRPDPAALRRRMKASFKSEAADFGDESTSCRCRAKHYLADEAARETVSRGTGQAARDGASIRMAKPPADTIDLAMML